MIKSVFWVAVGAVGALELDKWLEARKARVREHGRTGLLLDKLNDKLEAR